MRGTAHCEGLQIVIAALITGFTSCSSPSWHSDVPGMSSEARRGS